MLAGGGSLLSALKQSGTVRALVAPMNAWSPRARFWAGTGTVLIASLRALYSVVQSESVFVMADAPYYLAMAKRDYSQVVQPFASRQLGALVVEGLAHTLHWTIERSFLVEGAVSLVGMLALVCYLMLQTKAPRWMLLAVAIIPFWSTLLQYLVLPDLWFSALLAVMLVLVAKQRMMLASLMMFPLMLSRESTSLTLVCFLIAGWSALRWRDRIVAVAGTVGGAVVVSRLAAGAQSNVEHLPQAVYMLAKVPWNFVHNILGIVPWSNVYTNFCDVPAWTMAFRFGPVRTVGVCGFSTESWEFIAQAILSNFGLLPLLVGVLWYRQRGTKNRSVLLKFSLLYGGISLLLAPLLGVWFVHLIGYAWPLFLVAMPLLLDERADGVPTGSRAVAALAFLGLHVFEFYVSYRWLWWPQIMAEAMFWVVGYFLIRYWLGDERPDGIGSATVTSNYG
jgi:hypothetical protein